MRIIPRLVLTTLTMSALAACDRSVKEKPATSETPTGNHIPNKTAGGLRLVSDSQPACVDLDLTKILSSYEVTKCNGTKATGQIEVCAADASNCFVPTYAVATQPLKAISYNAIDVSKMLDTFTLSGATGTVVSRGSWALTAAFPGAGYYSGISAAPVAGNIKAGVSIFGLSGTLEAAVAPNAWDVRVETTINGVTGMLKVNCRNRVTSFLYNYDGSVGLITNDEIITASGSTDYDYWDTIDDYNNGVSGLPPGVVSGWTNNDCGGVETVADDANVWKDVTTAGTGAATCVDSPEKCTMKDKITGLHWSKIQSLSQTGSVAINTCDALSFNGQTDWRLPTQKELMEAYTHGIRSAATTNWITEGNMINNFWSGSSVSPSTLNAWLVNLAFGYTYNLNKTNSYQVVCVR